MLKVIKEQWDKNQEVLREALKNGTGFNSCSYMDLVKLAFDKVYNTGMITYGSILDIDNIVQIDHGNYQGTLLFVIPVKCYQPSEYEYLMTYIGYGSCSVCDALQSIQDYCDDGLTDEQVSEFMSLCRDILANTVKPFNKGWRYDSDFDEVEM